MIITTADGHIDNKGRTVIIKTVTVGNHTLHNVIAMAAPDGAMRLLGFSVLSMISPKFTINTKTSTLDFD
jgi:predicted aspartyl protease